MLLYGAERLGRGCVACQYDEGSALGEEVPDGLEGVFIHQVEGACAVWGARVVSQVEIVILREGLAQTFQYGEASVAGVEHADGRGLALWEAGV